jgi:gliding motility-associated protein GldM
MGATNCPETPRQRMIGMMYLVLTAMLALNVSKEILNAFITVNEAMERTNENFYTKINSTYANFAETAKSQDKAKIPYEKAVKVQAATKKMVEYMEEIKYQLHAQVDGIPVEEVKKQK